MFAVIVALSIIASFMMGWFYLIYAIGAVALVVAFVYLVAVARFDERPSDEEEEKQARVGKHASEHANQ